MFRTLTRREPDATVRRLLKPSEALRTVIWLVATAIGTWFTGFIYPGVPSLVLRGQITFVLAGTWMAFSVLVPWPWLRRAVAATLITIAIVPCGLNYLLLGWLGLFLENRGATLALATVTLAPWLAGMALASRPAWHPFNRIVGPLVVLGNSILPIAVLAHMWIPPSIERCEEVLQDKAIRRLTPASYAQGLSYPYSMLYLPEDHLLVATMKMAGNLLLGFWNEPTANRILVFDVLEPREPRTQVIDMTGDEMPENLAYDDVHRQVLATRIGNASNHVDAFAIDSQRTFRLAGSVSAPFNPNPIVTFPDQDLLMVFGQEWGWMTFSTRFLSEMAREQVPPGNVLDIQNTIDAFRPIGSRFAYTYSIGTVGGSIGAIDPLTYERKKVRVSLGFGRLGASTETGRVYRTNAVSRSFDEFDLETLAPTRSADLGYAPRPFIVDPTHDLLIIASWFDGRVHLLRLSTFEELRSPIPMGPYLRELAYDAQRHLLFTGDKCGVFMVSLEQFLEFGSDGTPASSR